MAIKTVLLQLRTENVDINLGMLVIGSSNFRTTRNGHHKDRVGALTSVVINLFAEESPDQG